MSLGIHTFSDNVLAAPGFNGALANSTQSGTGVDTLGIAGGRARRAFLALQIFTGAATTANFKLQDSPDNSTWTDVTGATLGSAIVASTADTGPYIVNIDLAKRQRYLRVQIIGTGTAGNAAAAFYFYELENAGQSQVQTPISV